MACPKCGSALSEAGTVCTVCDPWAAPVATATRGAAAPWPVAPQVMEPVPKWITRLAKRNPPAPADLAKAWRNTVTVSRTFAVLYALGTPAALAAFVISELPVSSVFFVLWISLFAVTLIIGTTFAKKTWLPRAVAVVGARPEIGYAGFASLPSVVRLTKFFNGIRVISFLLLAIILVSNQDHAAPRALHGAAWALLMLCGAIGSIWQMSLMGKAREELDRVLAGDSIRG